MTRRYTYGASLTYSTGEVPEVDEVEVEQRGQTRGHRGRFQVRSVDAVRETIRNRVEYDTNGGCWLWTGSCNPAGYGQINWQGRMRHTHRLSYELFRGSIPPGLTLDHLCRVTWCCNPDHLEPVTHKENCRRARKTHCPQGHPYSDENTRDHIVRGVMIGRVCRECHKIRAKNWYLKKRDAAR